MDNEVVAIVNNYALKQCDFDTLKGGEWLNDMVCSVVIVVYLCIYLYFQIINSYVSLIMDKFMDIHIFSSFFYSKLAASGYEAVCKWHNSVDLFTKRLMFPVHLFGNHWCLVSASLDYHKITLYDLLPSHGQGEAECMDIIETYLVLKVAEQKAVSKSWNKEICREPQQDNFNDCGVFVCMNGQNLAERLNFEFYLDVPHSRRHIKHELLNCKLLPF